MPKKTRKPKSRDFYVLTRTVVEKRYVVRAPSPAAALLPIETLVAHWPCDSVSGETKIERVWPVKPYTNKNT